METEQIAKSLVMSMVNDLGPAASETVLMRSLEFLRENLRKIQDEIEKEKDGDINEEFL